MKRTLLPLATVLALPAIASPALAQDPFGADDDPGKQPESAPAHPDQIPDEISICYETFSVDLQTAATETRPDRSDADLYQLLVALVSQGKATQDSLMLIRVQSGQAAKCESIFEFIYPTQWHPGEIPKNVGVRITPPKKDGNEAGATIPQTDQLENAPRPEDIPAFTTPAFATAFECRNLGTTIGVEPLLRVDGKTIDLSIAPSHVALAEVESWGQGVSRLEMPEIEARQLSTGVTAQDGTPCLLGTLNSSPHSKIEKNSAERVTFAFVTPSLVRR